MTIARAIEELYRKVELHGPETELVNDKGESVDFHAQQCPATDKTVIVVF
jgi:hypothetical protein